MIGLQDNQELNSALKTQARVMLKSTNGFGE